MSETTGWTLFGITVVLVLGLAIMGGICTVGLTDREAIKAGLQYYPPSQGGWRK